MSSDRAAAILGRLRGSTRRRHSRLTLSFRGDDMRSLQKLALGIALVCGVIAGPAFAQSDYPNKPIHWIVGYPPGGSTDLLARLMGQWLSQRLGQQVIVDNRPGGGNNIGTEMAIRAPADGYT